MPQWFHYTIQNRWTDEVKQLKTFFRLFESFAFSNSDFWTSYTLGIWLHVGILTIIGGTTIVVPVAVVVRDWINDLRVPCSVTRKIHFQYVPLFTHNVMANRPIIRLFERRERRPSITILKKKWERMHSRMLQNLFSDFHNDLWLLGSMWHMWFWIRID